MLIHVTFRHKAFQQLQQEHCMAYGLPLPRCSHQAAQGAAMASIKIHGFKLCVADVSICLQQDMVIFQAPLAMLGL